MLSMIEFITSNMNLAASERPSSRPMVGAKYPTALTITWIFPSASSGACPPMTGMRRLEQTSP